MDKNVLSLKEDFISRLDRNKKHLIALGIFIVLPLVLYNGLFFGGKQFFGNDVIQWRASAQVIKEYKSAHHGKNPLWDTNVFAGMPAYTISQPNPVPNFDTFIRKVSGKKFPVTYHWVLLVGFYIFFLLLGMWPLASAAGAIFISFTTYLPIIIGAGHYSQFIAFVYLPWIMIGYWLLSRTDKRWLGLFLFALATTLELRANHPQVTYYFLYLLVIWWIYDTIMQARQHQLKSWGFRTGLMILGGLVAILASLQNYLTLYQYAKYSQRGGSTLAAAHGAGSGGLSLHYAFQWSQGAKELLTLIIPGLFGGASGQGYWGPKPFTSGPHYLGAITFVLALIGIFRSKRDIKYLFFGIGTLTLLFSLGYHFRLLNAFMFHHIPFFDKFRTPEMWLMITIICYSVVAVLGIEALFKLAAEKRGTFKPLYWPLGIALAVGILFAAGNSAILSFNKPGQQQQIAQQIAKQSKLSAQNERVQEAASHYINTRLKPQRQKKAQHDSTRFLILIILTGALIYALYRQKLGVGLFMIGLIILICYDMLSVGNRFINKESLVSKKLNAEQVIQRQKGPMKTFIAKHLQDNKPYTYRVFPLLNNPFNNNVPAYFYPIIGGYSGTKLATYQDFINHSLTKGGKINMADLNMLNVKYITYNHSLPYPNLKTVYDKKHHVVMENTTVLPKAFFVDSVITASSPRQAINKINSASFDPAKWAVVESKKRPAAQKDSTASVRVTSYSANKVTLKTSRHKPGFMVLSEIYYPAGWQAKINGQPARIYKTNFILRGIEVPAGSHQITFTFAPATARWGKRLSLIGNLLLLCMLITAVFFGYLRVKGD
jgi:hypothetical protein